MQGNRWANRGWCRFPFSRTRRPRFSSGHGEGPETEDRASISERRTWPLVNHQRVRGISARFDLRDAFPVNEFPAFVFRELVRIVKTTSAAVHRLSFRELDPFPRRCMVQNPIPGRTFRTFVRPTRGPAFSSLRSLFFEEGLGDLATRFFGCPGERRRRGQRQQVEGLLPFPALGRRSGCTPRRLGLAALFLPLRCLRFRWPLPPTAGHTTRHAEAAAPRARRSFSAKLTQKPLIPPPKIGQG